MVDEHFKKIAVRHGESYILILILICNILFHIFFHSIQVQFMLMLGAIARSPRANKKNGIGTMLP